MAAEWIPSLAALGAQALLGAAATDAWQGVKLGFARLFGRRGGVGSEVVSARLDAAAAEVEQADQADRERVRAALLPPWQTRLSDLLEEHPSVAEELRGMIEEVRAALPAIQLQGATAIATGSVSQTSEGGTQVAVTGVVSGDLDIRGPDAGR